MEKLKYATEKGEKEITEINQKLKKYIYAMNLMLFIKVKDDRIVDIKFKTFGCGAAIAVSSMITEMAKGKTIDEALTITKESVANELEGLPPQKMHCSNLGADALKKAIEDYRSKKK